MAPQLVAAVATATALLPFADPLINMFESVLLPKANFSDVRPKVLHTACSILWFGERATSSAGDATNLEAPPTLGSGHQRSRSLVVVSRTKAGRGATSGLPGEGVSQESVAQGALAIPARPNAALALQAAPNMAHSLVARSLAFLPRPITVIFAPVPWIIAKTSALARSLFHMMASSVAKAVCQLSEFRCSATGAGGVVFAPGLKPGSSLSPIVPGGPASESQPGAGTHLECDDGSVDFEEATSGSSEFGAVEVECIATEGKGSADMGLVCGGRRGGDGVDPAGRKSATDKEDGGIACHATGSEVPAGEEAADDSLPSPGSSVAADTERGSGDPLPLQRCASRVRDHIEAFERMAERSTKEAVLGLVRRPRVLETPPRRAHSADEVLLRGALCKFE